MRRGGRSVQPDLLATCLENHTVPLLKKLAGLLTTHAPTRKAELVGFLRQHLEDPASLREIWASLDPFQQAAVAEVVHGPTNRFDAAGFRAKYGQDPAWGKLTAYGRDDRPTRLHLFFYRGIMPRDLKERLRAFVPPPLTAQVETVDEPPATVLQTQVEYDPATQSPSPAWAGGLGVTRRRQQRTIGIPVIRCETERVALHDVQAVLRLIDAGKVRASAKTQRTTGASVAALAGVLQGGDFYALDEVSDPWHTAPGPIKSFAWPLLVQAAGLATLAGTKLQLTAAGQKALAAPPQQALRRAWDRWLKTRLLDEFNRVQAIKGQTGKGKRQMTAVAGRRAAIVAALQACPPHEWIAVDELSRFMRAAGHTFEVARDLWSLYIADPNYGSLGYAGYGEWHMLQGRYILAFLFEYAATLGLIDVAYIHPSGARPDYHDNWGTDDLDCLSRYDGLLYFRINGLGAWCLGLTEAYEPAPLEVQQVLQVLPNRDVVATAPLPPADALFLELFAEQTSDAVWRIQPVRLLEALEQGHTVADIQAFLVARAGGSLPDNVAVFFQDVAERAARLADRGPARLIEAQDEALAQLIAHDSRLRSLCMLAGDRYLVVPAEAESAFRRALRELGYGLPPAGGGS